MYIVYFGDRTWKHCETIKECDEWAASVIKETGWNIEAKVYKLQYTIPAGAARLWNQKDI